MLRIISSVAISSTGGTEDKDDEEDEASTGAPPKKFDAVCPMLAF